MIDAIKFEENCVANNKKVKQENRKDTLNITEDISVELEPAGYVDQSQKTMTIHP